MKTRFNAFRGGPFEAVPVANRDEMERRSEMKCVFQSHSGPPSFVTVFWSGLPGGGCTYHSLISLITGSLTSIALVLIPDVSTHSEGTLPPILHHYRVVPHVTLPWSWTTMEGYLRHSRVTRRSR